MEDDTDKKLRRALVDYFEHSHTHAPLSKAIAGISEKGINAAIAHVEHTPWMLLEHIRITAHDMLEFVRNPDYKSLNWPEDYWPPRSEEATMAMWKESAKQCGDDVREFAAIIKDDSRDLFETIGWGDGQTIFLEAIQMIDHASYHIGELVLLRRALGEWKD